MGEAEEAIIPQEQQQKEIVLTEEEYQAILDERERRRDEELKETPVKITPDSNYDENASLYLLRDLRLYKVELWLLLVPIIAGLFIAMMSLFGVVPPIFNIGSFAIMAIVAGGVYMFKRANYMPSKDKRLVERIYQSGQCFFTCEKIKDGKVKFGGTLEPTTITNLVAHVEGYSGQPLVKCYEGHYENLNVNKVMRGIINARSSKFVNDLADEAANEGARLERVKNQIAGKDINNGLLLIIMLIGFIAVIGSLFYLMGPQTEALESIKNSLDSMPDAIKNAIGTAFASAPQVYNVGG